MRFPVEVLVLVCIVVGLLPAATVGPFLDLAVRSVLGGATPYYSLAVWHGFNPPLLTSIIALLAGAALYFALQPRLLRGTEGPPLVRRLEGRRVFERVMVFLSWRAARSAERALGTRRLQPQLRLVVCVAVLAAGLAVWRRGLEPPDLVPQG